MSLGPVSGRHVIVHPADRWNLAAMREIKALGLPVVMIELMPRGKLFVVDPEAGGEPDLEQAVAFE